MAERFSIQSAFTILDRATAPIRKIQQRISRFSKLSSANVAKLGRAFAKIGATMGKALLAGAAASAAAIGATLLKTATLGDEAAKTSRRLGITAEALQELRFAADRQGVAASVLDSSFLALQKRVGELKAGTGSLYGFLKKTGDKAFIRQIALAKNTEEAFGLVTQKVETIKDPMQKAAFAAAAFSRSGIKMLSFMEAGREGIAQLRLEAQKYGAVISEKAAVQSEVFIDALTNLKSALAGIGKTFASKVIPFAATAMQNFADFWAMNKNIIGSGMDRFLLFISETFRAIKPGVVALLRALQELFAAFWAAATSLLPEFKTEIDSLSGRINMFAEALRQFAEIGVRVFQFIKNVSPFLKPLLATFLIYKGILISLALATKAWGVAQAIVNAIMGVNPITLIIVAIAALITAIIYLVQNWETVVAAFKTGAKAIWEFLSELLDNPFIAAAATIFTPFFAIPALIVKNWEPLSQFFSNLWNAVIQTFIAGVKLAKTIWSEFSTMISSGIDFVMKLISPFVQTFRGVFEKFGVVFEGSDKQGNNSTAVSDAETRKSSPPQVVTTSSLTRSILENRREETASAELLIRDETGRGQLFRRGSSPSIKIAMAASGD